MLRRTLLAGSAIVATLVATVSAGAFFDEIDELRAELLVWQETNSTEFTADIGDVMTRLDEMIAPIFGDVGEDTWFYPYVSSVAEWGIVSGYKNDRGEPTGQFRPGNQVTVAEVLKMALKAAEVDESLCLRPVLHPGAEGHWARSYVSCAEESGMRLFQIGFPELDRPATRAEVIGIVTDAFGDRVPPLYSTTFTDVAGNPMESDIAFAAARGIVSGDKDENGEEKGTFRPKDPIVRAEVAKIMYQRLRAQVSEE